MAARLGQFLYWVGCIMAVLIFGVGSWGMIGIATQNNAVGLLAVILVAGVVWLSGRACLYVLGGR